MKSVSLVLLPGLDGTGDLFGPLIDCLPDRIQPIVVSFPRDVPCGYDALKPIVKSALPEHTDFVILGESFSGPLAILAADERPPGLKGIILCASFIQNPFRLLPSWIKMLSVAPIYTLWPATIQLRAILYQDQERYRALAEMALAAIRSVKPSVVSERVKSIFSVNVEAELERCHVPILYLAGTKDSLVRAHNIRNIVNVKRDVHVSRIDTQHFILQLEPEKATREIVDFMEKIDILQMEQRL